MLPEPAHSLVLDDDAPKALKKYVLLGRLAKGGMAELFLARANGLGGFERLLVIKRVLPELARDAEFVRMLLDEARIVATLQHSNIVQVFDVDMDDGNVFFAMEHLHGQHVAEIVRRAEAQAVRIPLENAIAIAVAVAAGLHYAHERWGADGKPLDIVHRDVAPNNVIVTYDGNVKLIDFGIAKAANNLSKTRFGLFKGKLPYAAPEQCRCEPIDRRTDVYSLGALLYELTTGQPLFVADNEYELLRLMSEAVVPRPRLRDKSYPRELEQIVLKALARDPAERYQTAQALQRDLEVFAGRMRLDVSAFSLSRLMEGLFGDKLDEWKASQRAGLSLAQHITRTTAAVDIEGLETEELVDAPVEPPAARSQTRVTRAGRPLRAVTPAPADAFQTETDGPGDAFRTDVDEARTTRASEPPRRPSPVPAIVAPPVDVVADDEDHDLDDAIATIDAPISIAVAPHTSSSRRPPVFTVPRVAAMALAAALIVTGVIAGRMGHGSRPAAVATTPAPPPAPQITEIAPTPAPIVTEIAVPPPPAPPPAPEVAVQPAPPPAAAPTHVTTPKPAPHTAPVRAVAAAAPAPAPAIDSVAAPAAPRHAAHLPSLSIVSPWQGPPASAKAAQSPPSEVAAPRHVKRASKRSTTHHTLDEDALDDVVLPGSSR